MPFSARHLLKRNAHAFHHAVFVRNLSVEKRQLFMQPVVQGLTGNQRQIFQTNGHQIIGGSELKDQVLAIELEGQRVESACVEQLLRVIIHLGIVQHNAFLQPGRRQQFFFGVFGCAFKLDTLGQKLLAYCRQTRKHKDSAGDLHWLER